MRLIRLGAEPSTVGADVRVALSALGRGGSLLGGVALLGVRPPDCPRPLDAIVVLPRGVLVIVGVDLPAPAMRLEAPLGDRWKIDGWSLVSPDDVKNPATEAVRAATAVAHRIQAMRAEPLPVSTVVAVGPYVSQVVQPTVDLNRGVRVLYPKPTTLLAAARELGTSDLPCTVEHAAKLLAVLSATGTPPSTSELLAEGFADAVTADLASADTMLIPKLTAAGLPASRKLAPWLPLAGAALAALLLLWLVVAISADDETSATATPPSTAQPTTVVVDGASFAPMSADRQTDCAAHAYGDVRAWLAANSCGELRRARYETDVNGRRAMIMVAELDVLDAPSARAFHAVVAAPGSGGVTALGQKPFERAAFASSVRDTRVYLAQAVWAEGDSAPTDPALTALATTALRLPTSQ